MENAPWEVSELSNNVHTIDVLDNWKLSGFEFKALITSDWHYDNPKCDRKLLHAHLAEAKRIGAPVFCNGDLFCLMQGKRDKRGSKQDVRPEHQVADYYDAVARTSAEDLSEFAQNIAVVGYGNHETAIIKHQETDVLQSFARRMRNDYGSPMKVGGYGGWIFFRFKNPAPGGGSTLTLKMKYFHGSGGGGPVTKGVIKANRMAVYLPDADLVTTGHIHEKWALRYTHERVTGHGRVYLRDQLHLCTGTYKEEYQDGSKGWHVERGAAPKPMGGYWVTFKVKRSDDKERTWYVVAEESPTL